LGFIGCGVQDVGFGAWISDFGVKRLKFGGLGFRGLMLRYRYKGLGIRV
jgi:hypothetical protein